MDKLLLHCDTCDAKLISSDQKEFLVHKAVVASASDVLKLHFFSCHQNTSVHQMECKSKALVHIIDFMYKGQSAMVCPLAGMIHFVPGILNPKKRQWKTGLI